MIGLRPNVAGSSRLIPASGPSPGSMPTRVPITQPANAYARIEGWSATEKPSIRLLKTSAITFSQPPRPLRQLDFEKRGEDVIGNERKADCNEQDRQRPFALDHAEHEYQQRNHGEPIANALERKHRNTARNHRHGAVHGFAPVYGVEQR